MPCVGGAPRVARLRDRRRGREGQRRRAAAPAGCDRARAALGDRLEVRANDRRHQAQPDRLEPRQVRRPSPVRDARARSGGRRDRQARDAPQRGGSRPQGHPSRRGGNRAAGRGRDPAGALSRPARGRARGSATSTEAPEEVPDLQDPHRQARGFGIHEMPEPRLRRATLAAAQALCRRDGHRRARGEAGFAVHGARVGREPPPTSIA